MKKMARLVGNNIETAMNNKIKEISNGYLKSEVSIENDDLINVFVDVNMASLLKGFRDNAMHLMDISALVVIEGYTDTLKDEVAWIAEDFGYKIVDTVIDDTESLVFTLNGIE